MHTASTYMLLDIAGSLWGTAVFAAVLLAPGYLVARWLDMAGFRQRGSAEQLAWSVVLSFGLGTICVVAVAWLGMVAAEALVALAGLAAIAVYARSTMRGDASRPRLRLAHLLFFAWVVFVVLNLVDIGSGSRLWMSVTTYDHSVRVPFVDAVMRTGVVPVNPLYWPGHDAPLRYYYFWYVLCGVVAKLAHISARQAVIASCVWPAVGVAAMLALYGRHVLGWRGLALRSRTRMAVAFLAVTGIDVLIPVFNRLSGDAIDADMEWWSVDQVTSWADVFLWVPHHAAALVCCLLSFLLLWLVRNEVETKRRLTLGLLAGLSFASAFGLSTYVAIGFCFVMAFWLLRVLLRTRDRRPFPAVAVAALVAGVVLSPYVLDLLRQGSPGGGKAPHILSLQVRQMLQPVALAGVPAMARLAAVHPFRETQIAALILLVPGYCIELGFFTVVILLALRLRDKTDGERTLLYLLGAALVSVSFLRSTVITTNDYGSRAMLLAQFFLLPLAVRVWETSRGLKRLVLVFLAFLGVSGSVYQVITLRTYLPWQETHGNALMAGLAERNYALHDAYKQLDRRIPLAARIQYGAPAGGFYDGAHTLNAQRQIIAAGTTGTECNTGFGGEVSACAAIRQAGVALYGVTGGLTPPANLPMSQAVSLCTGMGAQYLVATRWDPVWADGAAWPWRLPAVVSTPEVRVVACRTG